MASFQDQVQTNFLNNANFANAVADRPYQQYGGPRIAGFNGDQSQSFDQIRGLQTAYQPYLNSATQAINGVMASPAGGVSYNGPTAQGYVNNDAAAAGINRGDIRNITAGSFLQGDIGAYMNPYTSQVIDQSMQDLDRARMLQQQGINSQAASRGAFGGSRQAIAETENNRNFMDQQARTSAQLRAQGFDTAASLMNGDMNRSFQAQQANQGADMSVAGANAGFTQSANQFNAGNRNAAAQFGASANNQFNLNNANQNFAAQQFNAQQTLNNNAQRLQAAGAMGQLGAVGQSLGLNAANALSASGLLQQQQVQRSYDLANQDFTNQFNYPLQQLAIRQSGISNSANGLAGATPVAKGNSTATALGALGTTSAVLKNLGISGSDVLNGVSSLFGSSAPSQAPSIGPQVSFGDQDFGNLFGSGSNNFGFNFLGGAQ